MNRNQSHRSISERDLHDALKTDYDIYKIVDCAEDKEKAFRHKRAKKVGKIHMNFSKITNDFCQCCRQPCYNKKYDLSTSTDKFAQFSSSTSIYFKFNIFCITILFIGFVFYGIIGNFIVADNITSRNCFFNNCEIDRLFISSYTALSHKIFFAIFFFLTIILKDAFFLYIRKYNFRKDESKITPSDFTAFIQNIDVNIQGSQIENILKDYFFKIDRNIEVKKINLIYDIQDQVFLIRKYSIAKRKQTILEKKMAHLTSIGQQNNSKFQKYQQELKEIKKELRKINSDIKEITDGSDQSNLKFTGKAFVTFATQQSLRNVIAKHQSSYNISRAVEPQDIIWENLGVKKLEKIKRRFLSYFISLILICLSFFIILGLSFSQENISVNSTLTRYSITLVISITIIIVNLGIRFSLIYFTKNEKRTTYTHQEYNIVFKVTLVYFTNMALIILITNIIVWDNKFNLVLWGSSGVAPKTQAVLALTVLSDFLFTLFNPFYLLKKSQRIYHERKIKNGNIVLQCEYNFSNEGIIFDIAAKYYTMFKIVSFCFFYMTISPYLLLFGIVHLILSFIANKYMLITKCNRPIDLDFKFSAKMIKNFEFCVLIMALGYFGFNKLIKDEFDAFSIIALIIALFDWIIMDLYLIHRIFKPKFEIEKISYDDACLIFPVDYDRENPMTQRQAFQEWFDEMRQRKQGVNQKIDNKNKIAFSMINPKKNDKKYDFNVLYNYVNNGYNMQSNLFSNQVHPYDLQYDNNIYNNQYQGDIDFYKLNNMALLRNNNYYYQTQFNQQAMNNYQPDFKNQYQPIAYPVQDIPLKDDIMSQDQPLSINQQKQKFNMFVSVFKPKQKNNINLPDDQKGLLNNNTPPSQNLDINYNNNQYPNFQNPQQNNNNIPLQIQPDQINEYNINYNQQQKKDVPLTDTIFNNQNQQHQSENQYAINFKPQQIDNRDMNYNNNFNQNNQDQPLNSYQVDIDQNIQNVKDVPLNINSEDFRIKLDTEIPKQKTDQNLNLDTKDQKYDDKKKEQLINKNGYLFIITYNTQMC